MLNITKIYRSEYEDEDIITDRTLLIGVWNDTTENVPNAVTNNQISNRAVVIGNGPSRLGLNLTNLNNYSGLLGADTVQTYGCNALYRDFTPDFLVATGNNGIVSEIANNKYATNNIVYTNAIHLLEYPNKFYLIPFDPYTDAGTTAMYIAAFDGHKTIYMIGMDGQGEHGYNYNVYSDTNGYDTANSIIQDYKWIADRTTIFNTYNDIDFVRVIPTNSYPTPEAWKYCANFRQILFYDFVLEANL